MMQVNVERPKLTYNHASNFMTIDEKMKNVVNMLIQISDQIMERPPHT